MHLGDRQAHLHFTAQGGNTAVTLTGDMGVDVHVLPS
jgi:hypothetical protein